MKRGGGSEKRKGRRGGERPSKMKMANGGKRRKWWPPGNRGGAGRAKKAFTPPPTFHSYSYSSSFRNFLVLLLVLYSPYLIHRLALLVANDVEELEVLGGIESDRDVTLHRPGR